MPAPLIGVGCAFLNNNQPGETHKDVACQPSALSQMRSSLLCQILGWEDFQRHGLSPAENKLCAQTALG